MKLIFYVLVVLAGYSAYNHYQQSRAKPEAKDGESAYAYFQRSPDIKVVLYSTEWCGYCDATREYLDSRGIAFTDLDIEKSERAKREHAILGGKGVPLTLVGDQKLHGFNAASLEAAVNELK